LDPHDYPIHHDLVRLVRHGGTADRFVAASSSITKGAEGSKRKAGGSRGNPKHQAPNRKHQSAQRGKTCSRQAAKNAKKTRTWDAWPLRS